MHTLTLIGGGGIIEGRIMQVLLYIHSGYITRRYLIYINFIISIKSTWGIVAHNQRNLMIVFS